MTKEERRLRVGVLGCGPVAQAAHLESCAKARNADLHAVCDRAPDLVERMRWTHAPARTYLDYDAMLADPDVEAVVVATADAFHVPASIRALEAGKHVLCEKPLATSVEEAERLRDAVRRTGLVLQVGHMRRFDPGVEAAADFAREEMGGLVALKAWYGDSTHRYTMTDALQPLRVSSGAALKPVEDPRADLRRYFMLAHGSHLVDTARYLAGEIVEVEARHALRFGAHCWFVGASFASGALGHLDLTVAVRMDWHEGFHLYGERGSAVARCFSPWYFRSSEVEVFSEADATYRRPLGADGHFYRRQLEGFADAALHGKAMRGANAEDGVASVRAMVAIARSAEAGGRAVRLADVEGAV